MGRTFCVSDIHGHYDLWTQIKEYLQSDDKLYILGDCGDRGPEGWKIIREALADPRVVYIRGNHDQMLLDCWKSDWRDTHLWFYNGGYETYNAALQDEKADLYLRELNKTKTFYEYTNAVGQTVFLSHAGFTLHEGNIKPDDEELLWDRDHIEDACDWWPESDPNVYCVHGHSYCWSTIFRRRAGIIPDDITNDSRTVTWYAHGHKICIDARSFVYGRICLFNLDTLKEEAVFYDDNKEMLWRY